MNNLRTLREDNDWTLEYVGSLIGASATAISRYETEKRSLTAEIIAAFCALYGVSADYLLGLSPAPVSDVSKLDRSILAAYHAAPASIKRIVHVALAPYQQEKYIALAA